MRIASLLLCAALSLCGCSVIRYKTDDKGTRFTRISVGVRSKAEKIVYKGAPDGSKDLVITRLDTDQSKEVAKTVDVIARSVVEGLTKSVVPAP